MKNKNKKGILGYLVDNDNDDDSYDDELDDKDDVFGNEKGEGADKKEGTTKLIDLDLVRLIKFCNDLYK